MAYILDGILWPAEDIALYLEQQTKIFIPKSEVSLQITASALW